MQSIFVIVTVQQLQFQTKQAFRIDNFCSQECHKNLAKAKIFHPYFKQLIKEIPTGSFSLASPRSAFEFMYENATYKRMKSRLQK